MSIFGRINTRGSILSSSFIALVLIALVSACSPTKPGTSPVDNSSETQPVSSPFESLVPQPLQAGEKLKVVATTNIVGDVVSQVGGTSIELTTLMGVGVDPHTFVATPADSAAIYDAHVVFANGAGLEANLQPLLDHAGGEAARIELSRGLRLRTADKLSRDDPDEGGHNHEAKDPHVWFDVKNVIHWVDAIEEALSALDPANAQVFASNAGAYRQQLQALDAWVSEHLSRIPPENRRLVTSHPSFGYLADRYGLEQLGAVFPVSPSSEPSAQDIAALENAIREFKVPAVFSESTVSPKLARQVADDTGIRLIPLHTGSLGEPGSGAESYIDMIRFDVTAIVDGLQ